MTYQHLLVKREEAITTITLNRPEKRNALALDVMVELTAAVEEVGESDALGVILAANGPVFSAGHNFGDMRGASLADAATAVPDLHRHDGRGPGHTPAGGGQGSHAGHGGGMPARGVL